MRTGNLTVKVFQRVMSDQAHKQIKHLKHIRGQVNKNGSNSAEFQKFKPYEQQEKTIQKAKFRDRLSKRIMDETPIVQMETQLLDDEISHTGSMLLKQPGSDDEEHETRPILSDSRRINVKEYPPRALELLALAKSRVQNAHKLPVWSESKATFRKIYMEWVDGCPYMVHFQSIKGITPRQFTPFFATNFCDNLNAISPKGASYTQIEHNSPHLHMMVKIDMGFPMIAARCCPVVAYEFEDPGDELSFMTTTEGCEHLIEKYKVMMGKCVVPSCELNYFMCKPWYDDNGTMIGTKLEQVCKVDPKGNFPDFIKTITARFLAEPIMMVADFILNPPK